MGYTTRFSGHIALSRTLTMKEAKYLLDIADESVKPEETFPDSYLQWVPSSDLSAIV